jgi:ubiquinone/menaquinone biosynthesis C-methylase UbiE
MNTTVIEKNKAYSDKYVQKNVENSVLPDWIKQYLSAHTNIVDLGCGDGPFIFALNNFLSTIKITGIDISERRICSLKKKFKKYKFFCEDVSNTSLKSESYNFVYCSQVIEHVPDDKKLVKEINRILSKEGFLYVSSVIKKPCAIYKYRNKGKFVLDPTPEREYKTEEEFFGLFNGLNLIFKKVYPVKRKVLFFKFKVPGFYIVEGFWKK